MKRNHFFILLGLAVCIVFGFWLGRNLFPGGDQLRGTLTFDPQEIPSEKFQLGDFIAEWQIDNGGQLAFVNKANPDRLVWQTIPGESFVMGALGNERVTESRGMFKLSDQVTYQCNRQDIENMMALPNSFGLKILAIRGKLTCTNQALIPYMIWFVVNPEDESPANEFHFMIVMDIDPGINRAYFTYQSNPDEHYFGFGEQFSHFDMKDKLVPIWVSEQGVGRGKQPITAAANLTNNGAGGNEFTTYAPFPYYITDGMKSVFLTQDNGNWDPPYTTFDLRERGRVQIGVWSPRMYGVIAEGEKPADIIKTYSSFTGRMKMLPDWIYSDAIVGMQGGTEKVQQVYNELKKRNTPISAFWLQDWVGQRTTSFGKQLWWNWEVDYDHYPKWDEMIATFRNDDIRVMIYVSPYLADIGNLKPNIRRNLFQEAKEKGYLIKNQNGEPYLLLNTDFYFGMVDFTNPEARDWYKSVIKDQVAGSGASGWMADFGEGLPYDAVLFDPYTKYREPGEYHNIYPGMWAKFNREVVDELGDDLIFFNRSASPRSPAYASLFWEGDQLVDWSAEDGIKSAVTGLNTSGLSGMAFNHSDIGGYTTITSPIKNYHRSRELLYRWMEMNAFTLIFRTHEGNQPENNIQFYTDDETLDTFAYWAKVYAALFDYRKQLVKEATETGLPVVRHPFIHYPDDPETWKITYQEFMLGADFLIAPVTDPDTTRVKVYLPKGRWVHVWTGTVYDGGQYLTIDAPLGQPAVFFKEESLAGQNFVAKLQSQNLMP